jgi:hypothetical protein
LLSSRTSRAEDLYEFLVQLIVARDRDETRKLVREMWLFLLALGALLLYRCWEMWKKKGERRWIMR